MSDFVGQPLKKKQNKGNPISAIEKLQHQQNKVVSLRSYNLADIGDEIIGARLVIIDTENGMESVIVDQNGIGITLGTAYADIQAYKFISGSTTFGGLFAFDDGTNNDISLKGQYVAGRDGKMFVIARGGATKTALVTIEAQVDGVAGGDPNIQIAQDASGNGSITLTADSLVFNGGASIAALTTGTYTPILTNTTNIAASTAYVCQYMRVGNMITVSGKVDIDATTTGLIQLGMSLPVASNLANSQECAGVAMTGAVAGQALTIAGDTTNDRATFVGVLTDAASRTYNFIFMYQVI